MTKADIEVHPEGLRPLLLRPGEAGMRRNQLIDPRPGVVRADVEDDFHRFWVEIEHDGTHVIELRATALRWPWSTCPGAAAYLGQRMKGVRLDALAETDSPYAHCTHMLDLAVLAAAHALDDAPTLYSCFVSDRTDPAQLGELYRNGQPTILWETRDSVIVSPGRWEGLSLRKLKEWERGFAAPEREQARVLRRAMFIAGGRQYPYDLVPTANLVTASTGACFTFQPERSAQGACTMDLRDFRDGPVPLAARIEEVARARSAAD